MKRNQKLTLLLVALSAALAAAAVDEETQWQRRREAMVRNTIAASSDRRHPVRNRRVLNAMRATPRHPAGPAKPRPPVTGGRGVECG